LTFSIKYGTMYLKGKKKDPLLTHKKENTMNNKKFYEIIEKAKKEKAMVVVSSQKSSETFATYSEIYEKYGESEGFKYLIKNVAKNQLEKINSSSRIKKDKKDRVAAFWTPYA